MSTAERIASMLEVPVFHPTMEEFQNVGLYVQKIGSIAEKVGLCKICPPPDWLPPCLVDDNFQFTASVQRLGQLKERLGGGRDKRSGKEIPFGATGKNECTVLSFGEMADDFKRDYFKMPVDRVSEERIEQEFWRLISPSADDAVTVYGGRDLGDTMSAFPTIASQNLYLDDLSYMDSNWNLNNIAAQSVLKYLTQKIVMKVPKCSIGMCFSYSPFQTEEYWSYSISYLHWGESQTWYCIPGSALESFDKYAKERDQAISKDVAHQSEDQDLMFNPEDLLAKGIPVASVVQRACEFVITFPRSVAARVSHGFNLTEKVNFCPNAWLPIGNAFSRRQERLAKSCVFSFEELLFRILLHVDSLDTNLVDVANQVLSVVKREELEAIERLSSAGLTKQKREIFELLPDGDRTCCVCRKTCFLSAVTCQCGDRLVCLRDVSELCECSFSRRCLHYRYTSAEMESKLERLRDRMREYERWVQKVNDTLNATNDEEKLDLVQMKRLKAEAAELYPQSHLVTSLKQVIADAQTCSAFARRSICGVKCEAVGESGRASSSSSSLSSKLSIDELESFFKTMTKIPIQLKETKSVALILEAAVRFQTRLRTVILGSIPDCSTLEELVSSSRGLSVSLPETSHLEQLVEQRKWLDGVERRLADPSRVTIDLIGKLIEEGVGIHPHPSCEKMLAHLQQQQSLCIRLEDRAKHCLQTKPSSPLSAVETLLDEASKVPVHLPTILELGEAANRASEWLANVENILNGQCSPYLIEVEKCLQVGHAIPIQLEKVTQLESLIGKTEEWLDRTSKAFIRKNSVYSLYEILCPRTDIGTSQSYKIRRKKATDVKVGTSTGLPVHWLLPDLNLDCPDPATVAAAFKMAEVKEVEDIVTLRNTNLRKLSSDFTSSAKYCLCRQGKTSNMMQCELCKEIFHSACVTLPKSFQGKSGKTSSTASSSSSELKFFCPMCMRSRRPRLETLIGLLLDLGKFPIRLPEGEALQSLAEHAFSWQDRARRLLATDELARALARLTVLNQQMAEHAAKVKTDRIIRSELIKAAKHRHAKHSMDYEYASTSSGGLCAPGTAFPGGNLSLQDVEVQMRVTALGGMSFEHAYSSASKHSQLTSGGGQHLRRSGNSDEPVLELSDSTLSELEQLIIEGDLLEVSLDETHHLWKIMKACQPSQAEMHGQESSSSGGDYVAEPDEKSEKVIRRKRKASHNMKVDESFEEEASGSKPTKQTKAKHQKDKGWSGQEKKLDRNAGEKNVKARATKLVKREKSAVGVVDSDEDGNSGKSSEDCEAEKCLRPLGNAVKWVQCDGCEKWYHYFCLGLSKCDISEHKEFLCQRCHRKNPGHVVTPSDGSRCSSTSMSGYPTTNPFPGGASQ